MFKLNENNIGKFNIIAISLVLIIFAFVIASLNISSRIDDFNLLQNEFKEKILNEKKEFIKIKVHNINNLINEKNRNRDTLVKNITKERVENAYKIVDKIYNKYKNTISNKEIINIIKNTLRPIRYDDGTGYIFIASLKGKEILYPVAPEYEGTNIINLKDAKGNYVIKEEIEIVKKNKEGYVKDFWTKPNTKDHNMIYPKITFVKLFKELDFYIGSGVYIDDIIKKDQLYIQNLVTQLNKQNIENYIVISNVLNINGGKGFAKILIHPIKEKGTLIDDDKKDIYGNYYRKEYLKGLRENSQTFLHYSFYNPKIKKDISKISYFLLNKDWNWIIATGFYDDFLKKDLSRWKTNLYKIIKLNIYSTIGILILFSIMLLFIIYTINKITSKIIDKYKQNVKIKEQELQKINQDLEKKIKDKTIKLQNNMNIMSQYVIYSKTDLDGYITEVSDAFCKTTKYKKEELIGENHNILRDKDVPAIVYKQMWETIKENKSWRGEISNIDKDGKKYWISTTISPDYDTNGNKIGYIAIRHNITAIKEFEQQQDRLKQSEKLASMGDMIGNIAHQWRQPLSVISTASTGMKIQKEMNILDDESFYRNCEAINQNAQYLSSTIDDFKNFIKGDRVRSTFYLEDEINSFLNLVDGSIKGNNIDIVLNLEPQLQLDGYENELTQCLINIFNNAKDALKDADVENKLIFISTLKQDEHIVIKIKDNAGGIAPNIIDKIFEPYFTTKHQSQGTGLGLHMTYNLIVDGMDGSIQAQNVSYVYNDIKYRGAEFIIKI
jgi:PAS domain S-box-containing protein